MPRVEFDNNNEKALLENEPNELGELTGYDLEIALLAQQGFEIIDVQVDLIRNLMSKIKGSVNLCDSIRGLCNVERVDHLKPEIDIKTRRDITFCMETTLRTLGTEEASIQNLLPDINGVKQLRKLEN
ncbi:14152_t:CDS:2 [Entrophospora sp. SA101]|nr:14152_t:CDS:2 [Entrophospora sp. SA101]